jgi:3-isopropylmalate/(R)-2-methylmalate dehydratase large subunit
LGYISSLIKSGATISATGCGACLGVHCGLLADDEVCISATNRNFPGRMGSKKSKVYLSSPSVVAASVLKGCITDPRILGEED